MSYNVDIKNKVLSILENKVLSTVDSIIILKQHGYNINRYKEVLLEYNSILIHAFQNVDVLNDKQIEQLEFIFNRINQNE